MPSFTRALFFVTALPLIALVTGCSAKDQHVFHSSVNLPTTIALIDTYKNESVWSMDIPVNHDLKLDFEGSASGQTGADGGSPSWVNWKLTSTDDLPTNTGRKRSGKLVRSDRIDLTGKRIRVAVSYRKSPEMPGSVDAAPVPEAQTAQSLAQEAIAESKQQAAQSQPDTAAQAVEEAAEEVQEAVEELAEEAADDVEEAAEVAVDEAPADQAVEAVEAALDTAESAPATQPTK